MNNDFFVLNNVDLYRHNSMRIHANAEQLYFPHSVQGLIQLCEQFRCSKDMLVLGKGSNTIFLSDNYSRPVICTDFLNRIDFVKGKLKVQCGATLSELAWFAMEKGIGGYEFLEDIPGSVGGALFMNAGTYDDTISQLVDSVTVYDYGSKRVQTLAGSELKPHWGKRESYFQKEDCCILECTLKADCLKNRSDILDKMLETKKNRYAKQPREYPNAGSVFKRPHIEGKPLYVWKLLEKAGLRGYRVGGAAVSDKHPGFIVNIDNCSGKDLEMLLDCCKKSVKELFGIELEEEWRIIKEEER